MTWCVKAAQCRTLADAKEAHAERLLKEAAYYRKRADELEEEAANGDEDC